MFLKLCYKQKVLLMPSTYKTPSVHLPALVELYADRILLTLKVVGLVIHRTTVNMDFFNEALNLPFLDQLMSKQIINEGKCNIFEECGFVLMATEPRL